MTTQPGEPGGLAIGAEIKLSIDSLRSEIRAARRERNDLNQLIYPIEIPAQQGTVAAGTVTLGSSELWGPREGKMWFLTRVTVDGLAGELGADAAIYGSVTSPGVLGQICATPSLAAGVYDITVATSLGGTVSATDFNNMRLRVGTTNILTSIMVDEAFQQPYTNPTIRVSVPANTNINVVAIAAGTTGAVYTAIIAVNPVPTAQDTVTLYRSHVQPQNRVHDFTASNNEWWPGEDFVLRAGQSMKVYGTGLTASTVTVSGDAIEVDAAWAGAYLL